MSHSKSPKREKRKNSLCACGQPKVTGRLSCKKCKYERRGRFIRAMFGVY